MTSDCSPAEKIIVDHVCALAKQNEPQVCLLYVVHSHTIDQNRYFKIKAEQEMHRIHKKFSSQQIKVFKILRSGEPERETLAEIESSDYDLVTMATHGHNFLADLLFGSVAKNLKHETNIPLLIRRGIKSDKQSVK